MNDAAMPDADLTAHRAALGLPGAVPVAPLQAPAERTVAVPDTPGGIYVLQLDRPIDEAAAEWLRAHLREARETGVLVLAGPGITLTWVGPAAEPLQAENARLRAELAPFAALDIGEYRYDSAGLYQRDDGTAIITVGDVKRIRALLNGGAP